MHPSSRSCFTVIAAALLLFSGQSPAAEDSSSRRVRSSPTPKPVYHRLSKKESWGLSDTPQPVPTSRRATSRPAPKTPSSPISRTPAAQVSAHKYPYPVAKKARENGFAISPYTGAKIPVANVPSGARVLDPSSQKVFINP